MIQLTNVEICGESDVGPFKGALTLSAGLQVISAHNSYGKSLAARAVAWCLGIEPLFGLPDNDPTFFPLAVREELDLEGHPSARVLTSQASIDLAHSDGRRIRLSRQIKGDPSVVRLEEYDAGGTPRTSRLHSRRQAMQDEHAGLQRFLYEWLGWPRAQVATFKGPIAEVYLENLAPLFYVEQDRHPGASDQSLRSAADCTSRCRVLSRRH